MRIADGGGSAPVANTNYDDMKDLVELKRANQRARMADQAAKATQAAHDKAKTKIDDYNTKVRAHQDNWVKHHHRGRHESLAHYQAAWKADWAVDGKSAMAEVQPYINDYDKDVENELSLAEQAAGNDPAKRATARTAKANEIAGRDKGDDTDQLLNDIAIADGKETPQQSSTKAAFNNVVDAGDRVKTAQDNLAEFQKLPPQLRRAETEEHTRLVNEVNTAEAGYAIALGNLTSSVGTELDTELKNLYGAGDHGVYTPDQIKTAQGHVAAAHTDLGPGLQLILNGVASVHNLTGKVQTQFNQIEADPSILTPAEKKLWDSGDGVTVALMRAAGVTYNPDDPALSPQEREIATNDAHLYALMKMAGVGITSPGGRISITTSDGKTRFATTDELKAYREGGALGLANTVLGNLSDTALTQDQKDLLTGADLVRLNYVTTQMQSRMSGTNPDTKDALNFLNVNMHATFSQDVHDAMWQQAGEPYFNRDWADAQVKKFGGDADGFGRWLQDIVPVAPKQVVDTLLDSTEANFPTHPGKNGYTTQTDLRELWTGLSLGIEADPSRAGDVAEWLINSSGGQMVYTLRTSNQGYGFNDTIRRSVGDGNGSTLADAFLGKLYSSKQFASGFATDLDFILPLGKEDGLKKHSHTIASQQYQDFLDHKTDQLNDYFDTFLNDPMMGKPMQVNKGHETTAFRNAVGRAIGLTPNMNQEKAKPGANQDYNVSWYADGSYEAQVIDVAVAWIEDQSDDKSWVTPLPVLYASKNSGVQGGGLFKVDRGDHKEVVIDGMQAGGVVDAALGDPNTSADDKPIDATHVNANWHYDSLQDLTDNSAYDDSGRIYMPSDWQISDKNNDHHVDLSDFDAARMTAWEWTKLGITATLAVASVVAAPFSGGLSLALFAAGTAWGGIMVTDDLANMSEHGQSLSLDNPNARMAYLNGAMTAVGAVSFGAGSLAKGVAELGDVSQSSRIFLGGLSSRLPSVPRAYLGGLKFAARMPGGAGTYSTIASLTGKASMIWGGSQTLVQISDLAENWDQMSVSERASGLTYGLLGVMDAANGFVGHKFAQPKAPRSKLTIEDNGAITLVRKDGAEPIVLHSPAGDGDAINIEQGRVTKLEKMLNEFLGEDLAGGLPSAKNRVAFLDDNVFEFLNMAVNGVFNGARKINAFTISKSNGDPVLMVFRKGAASRPNFDAHALHELIHFKTRGDFARLADLFTVTPNNPRLAFFEPASLKEGITEYMTWRVQNPEESGGPRTYREYLDSQLKDFENGKDVRLAYPHAALEAEHVALRMGEPALLRAMFGSDEANSGGSVTADSLAFFRMVAEDLAEPVPLTDDNQNGSGMPGFQTAASIAPSGPGTPRRTRVKLAVQGALTKTKDGIVDASKATVSWTGQKTVSAAKGTWVAVRWTGRTGKSGTKSAGWNVRSFGRGTVRFVRNAAYKANAPAKAAQRLVHRGRMDLAGRVATSFDQFSVNLRDPAGNPVSFSHSPWAHDVANGIEILGGLSDLFGDIHAHSRPYERRQNYPVRGLSRFEMLARMSGPYGRVLIGDIPQYCGFGHYSHVEPDGLSLKKAARLDQQNLKSYNQLIGRYRTWMDTIGRVKSKFGSIADDINNAAITGDKTTFDKKLKELRKMDGGQGLARRLYNQTRVDLRSGLAKDPFVVLRSGMSLTGFNPGELSSVNAVRTKMLERPGRAAFLGEITLQKELVDIMLGKDATLLNQAGVRTLQTALQAFESSGKTVSDRITLKAALDAFKNDVAYRHVQAIAGDTHNVLGKTNQAIDQHDTLVNGRTALVDKWKTLIGKADDALTINDTKLKQQEKILSDIKDSIKALQDANAQHKIDMGGLAPTDPEYVRLQGEIDANNAELAIKRDELAAATGPANEQISRLNAARIKLVASKTDMESKRDKELGKNQREIDEALADIGKFAGKLDGFLKEFDADQKTKIANFEKLLELAQESGLGVLIHCDWGNAGEGADGRPQEATTDYAYFDDLIALVKPYAEDGSQGRHAKVVLAHTGFGRLTKPDDTLVDFTHDPTSPFASRGPERMPEHIARLYKAREEAPNVTFDISWNDVGQRYVVNKDLSDGLFKFMDDHPDAIMFGTDTVKPVNREQYLQAFTELMPMFMTMASSRPDRLWDLLRGNFNKVMSGAEADVASWTEAQFDSQIDAITKKTTISKGDQKELIRLQGKLRDLQSTTPLLKAGHEKMSDLARDRFDSIIADWQASPLNGRLTATESQGFGIDPRVALMAAPNGIKAGWQPGWLRAALVGRAPPRDADLETEAAVAQRRTGGGLPADKKHQTRANLQAALRAAGVATAAAGGIVFDTVLHTHLVDGVAPASSAIRQVLFFGRLTYREYLRLSWDNLFEDAPTKLYGDSAHAKNPSAKDLKVFNRNIDIFLNRTIKLGKAYGVGEEDLAQVIALTGQFKEDANYFINEGTTKGWSQSQKKMALMGAIGNYQINIDRAIGVQAGSFDLTSTLTRAGRRLNDQVMATAAVGLATELPEIIRQIHEDYQLHKMHQLGVDPLLTTGGLAEDILALSLVSAVVIVTNRAGKGNTSLAERQILANRLQGIMLSTLAVRGATGGPQSAYDLVHSIQNASHDPDVQAVAHYAAHIADSLGQLDLSHLATGHPSLDTALAALRALLPAVSDGAALGANAVVTWQGVKSAFYEWERQLQGGVPDRGKVSRTNELLIAGLFASAVIRILGG